MSIGNGRRSAGRKDQRGFSPAFFNARTVANASPPVTNARSRSPAAMSRATSVTSTWGTDPPMPE